MKFTPCLDRCTSEGTHCEGCGRSYQEIAETKQLVAAMVAFIQKQEYENAEEFMGAINRSVLKKLTKPA